MLDFEKKRDNSSSTAIFLHICEKTMTLVNINTNSSQNQNSNTNYKNTN